MYGEWISAVGQFRVSALQRIVVTQSLDLGKKNAGLYLLESFVKVVSGFIGQVTGKRLPHVGNLGEHCASSKVGLSILCWGFQKQSF